MNRHIKFRGKRFDNKEWAYGYYVEDGFIYICSHNEDGFLQYNIVDPSTVGQFSGLLDRNGKEVYEGDVLVCIDNKANEHYREVVYHNGCFKLHNPYAKLPDTPICHHLVNGELNWEIFGNIHEQSKS